MTDFTNEFARESRRIDQLIWDAMSLVRGERVLFCGFANVAAWVVRAAEIGVDVSVIESDPVKLADLQDLGIPTLRGSTTLIPARDNSFDAIVAFHYLHEIDPTFHTQIVWELARVGKRIVIVEPAPPSDPLGKRISELYSRAKYEAGAFEEYRPIDYWRKLLAMVKADVLMQQFTFNRLAPRFAVEETVELILDAMEVEQLPEGLLDELRELSRRPGAQLTPLSRFVLVALGAGETVRNSAGTRFREEDVVPETPLPVAASTITPPPSAVPPARHPAGRSTLRRTRSRPRSKGPNFRPSCRPRAHRLSAHRPPRSPNRRPSSNRRPRWHLRSLRQPRSPAPLHQARRRPACRHHSACRPDRSRPSGCPTPHRSASRNPDARHRSARRSPCLKTPIRSGSRPIPKSAPASAGTGSPRTTSRTRISPATFRSGNRPGRSPARAVRAPATAGP